VPSSPRGRPRNPSATAATVTVGGAKRPTRLVADFFIVIVITTITIVVVI